MPKAKFIISIFIFSLFMLTASYIKNQTRIIEKNIVSQKKKIVLLENEFYEAQLDYYYLSSPESVVEKIDRFADENYLVMEHSNIYLSLSDFFSSQNQNVKNYTNEKNKKK